MGIGVPSAETTYGVVRGNWDRALSDSNFFDLLAQGTAANDRVLILVDLAALSVGDSDLPAPEAVEALIDLIHQGFDGKVDLATSFDGSQLYAANRDIYALADLLGYRFTTNEGNDYDIIDLGNNLEPEAFSEASSLFGSGLSADWIEAGFRLNFATLHPDASEGFAAGLLNLLRALPLADKDLCYGHRRNMGEVISDLLEHYPPDFTIIQAGLDNRRRRKAAQHFGIASSSSTLADFAAALKSGLDPYVSNVFEVVAQRHPLPVAYRIDGSLRSCEIIPQVRPISQRSAIARKQSEAGDRLLTGWLSQLDPGLFPANRPLDAKAQELFGQLIGNGNSATGNALLASLNFAVGAAGHITNAWRTLFSKDLLFRRSVSLGLDPSEIDAAAFAELVEEIDGLLPLVRAVPECAPGLRWRRMAKAVLFQYTYWTAIPFPTFVERVDVSRTIGFMNDYLGGTVVVLDRDKHGRPIRQAERNLYLPQPNYTVLYGGQPIDVTKVETVAYRNNDHRLYWKTLLSANGSATADDGMARFQRDGDGTRVTFVGKQRFTLPPFFQVFDVSLIPELEEVLTTQAYRTFFERTCANLEALVEGRDIYLGRLAEEMTAHPSLALERWLSSTAEHASTWFKSDAGLSSSETDEHGFVHVVPSP